MDALGADRLPTLVAVHGRKRSGKGTIAEHLVRVHGYRTVKFADPLKDMISALLAMAGLDPETVARCIESDLKELPLAALRGKSTRYTMQVIGTEFRDAVHTAMWSNIAVGRMRAARAAGGRVALDDLRFPHELAALEGEGAALWLVESARPEPVAAKAGIPGCLRAAGPIRLEDALPVMLAVLLGHCGAPGARDDLPLAVLGGRTAGDCLRALRDVWTPLMRSPWSPSPASTAGHLSERPLPREAFSAHLRNDTTFEALHAQVAAALLAEGARAAA